MAKSFFYSDNPEDVLKYLKEKHGIVEVLEKPTSYRVLSDWISIKKPDTENFVVPNIVLREEVDNTEQIYSDPTATRIFDDLKKRFGKPRKKVEDYYFPDMDKIN